MALALGACSSSPSGSGSSSGATSGSSTAGTSGASSSTGSGSSSGTSTGTSTSSTSGTTGTTSRGDGGLFGPAMGVATCTEPSDLAVGDFNGDGVDDLATYCISPDAVQVLLSRGTGAFDDGGILPLSLGASSLVACDFNHDGRSDLASASGSNSKLTVFLSLADGGYGSSLTYVDNSPVAMTLLDPRRDGGCDLALPNAYSQEVTVVRPRADGGLGVYYFPGAPSPATPTALAAADFDGDGQPDLAITYASTNTVAYLLGQPDGGFALLGAWPDGGADATLGTPVCNHPVAVAPLRAVGTGAIELAVGCNGTATLDLLSSWGDGGFTLVTSRSVVGYPAAIWTGDLSSDGVDDLVTIQGDDLPRYLALGDGGFEQQDQVFFGQVLWAVTSGDFNHDGLPDLVTSIPGGDSVDVMLGK